MWNLELRGRCIARIYVHMERAICDCFVSLERISLLKKDGETKDRWQITYLFKVRDSSSKKKLIIIMFVHIYTTCANVCVMRALACVCVCVCERAFIPSISSTRLSYLQWGMWCRLQWVPRTCMKPEMSSLVLQKLLFPDTQVSRYVPLSLKYL